MIVPSTKGKRVEDSGDVHARVIIIGEAPGATEIEKGKPFVGAAGHLLTQFYEGAGFVREHFYFTNVYPYQPPKNDISKVPADELEHYANLLREKISLLPDPFILVPLGNTAFRALTQNKESVMNWRGSIMEYQDGNRVLKMIPSIHPAAVLRQKKYEFRCRMDWCRIAQECQSREISLLRRTHKIMPTLEECREYANQLDPKLPIAVDIETHPDYGITCVGFAQDIHYSFTIPVGHRKTLQKKLRKTKEKKEKDILEANRRISFAVTHKEAPLEGMYEKKGELKAIEKWKETQKPLKKIRQLVEAWEEANQVEAPECWPDEKPNFITVGYWKDEAEATLAFNVIKEICESPAPKVMQNGFYDKYWLHYYGVQVRNWFWDTMWMHHALMPRDEHSLDYMASIFTREPFWKNEAKDAAESGRFASYKETLYTYNGKDCCLTLELFQHFYLLLSTRYRLQFYWDHYLKLSSPIFDMMLKGVKADKDLLLAEKKKYQDELTQLLEEVDQTAGSKLTSKKTVSAQRLGTYLYKTLKLPKQMRKRQQGERSESTDETAIRKLTLKFPEHSEFFGKILRVRRLSKLIGTYLQEEKISADGRFHSGYKLTTNSGRLSSSEDPFGYGGNAQNIDREIKHIFVAG